MSYTRSQFKIPAVLLLVAVALISFVSWGNKALVTTNYTVISNDLPASFNGFKIVQVFHLHNAEFGADNKNLINRINQADPDIIVHTGDMIDSHKTRVEIAVKFAQQAQEIAPTYLSLVIMRSLHGMLANSWNLHSCLWELLFCTMKMPKFGGEMTRLLSQALITPAMFHRHRNSAQGAAKLSN